MSAIPRMVFGRAGQKYNNNHTMAEGRRFHSKREADRYSDLLLLEKGGQVRSIRCQVVYKLAVHAILVCKYHADFVYEEFSNSEWREVVEDVKGYRTQVYKLKKKLMFACFGIEILET